MAELSAADWALNQVEAVREEPAKRLALLERTYYGPRGQAPHHLPFRRAATLLCVGASARRPRAASRHAGWQPMVAGGPLFASARVFKSGVDNLKQCGGFKRRLLQIQSPSHGNKGAKQ